MYFVLFFIIVPSVYYTLRQFENVNVNERMTIDHFLMFNVVFLPKLRTSIIFKTASSIVSSSNVYFFVFLPVASCAFYRFKLKSSIKNEIKTDIFITPLYCNTQMKVLWAAKLKNKSRRC